MALARLASYDGFDLRAPSSRINILHLLDDAKEAVARATELLVQGGLLVSSTPCLRDAGRVARAVLRLAVKLIPPYMRVFRTSQVEDLLRGDGLPILESEIRGDSIPLYFAVARNLGRGRPPA